MQAKQLCRALDCFTLMVTASQYGEPGSTTVAQYQKAWMQKDNEFYCWLVLANFGRLPIPRIEAESAVLRFDFDVLMVAASRGS